MCYYNIMIRLIEELALMKVPIAFKGAMVLKTALVSFPIDTDRSTADLDGDWVGNIPSMNMLVNTVNTALKNINPTLSCKPYRKYGVGKSAGLSIFNNGKELFTMDISMKQNPYTSNYKTVNGVEFVGASLQKMLADKIQCASTNYIFRRSKDLYDLYLLSIVAGYTTYDVYNIWTSMNKVIGDFDGFINRVDELKHAYEKMKNIINKPQFETVYERVYTFLNPFILKTNINLTWNGNSWV